MATSFKISYPDIAYSAVWVDPEHAYNEDRTHFNLIDGQRHNYAMLNAATASTSDVEFDTGNGNTDTADHIIIGRADLLKDNNVTQIDLDGGNGATPTYASVHTNASFSSATLYGPRTHDYFATFTESTAYRWWRWKTTVGSSSTRPTSKVYFGKFFDFGAEPDTYTLDLIQDEVIKSESIDGTLHLARVREPVYRLKATWRMISDSIAEDFMNNIAPRKYFFLYTDSFHDILDDFRLLHVELRDNEPPVHTNDDHDLNTISATFYEMHG